MNKAVLLLLCCSLVALSSVVQASTDDSLSLRYQSWDVGKTSGSRTDTLRGLPQISARAIAKGADGFIWVGTWNGLARFDGLDFDVFHTGNTPAMTGNCIDELFVDHDGRLWVATCDGILRVENQVFQRIHQAAQGFRAAGFAQTADGALWVGGDELWRVDNDALKAVAFADKGVEALTAVGDDLWVLGRGGALSRYRYGEIEQIDAAVWQGGRILALDQFRGALHITTADGVFRLSRVESGWRTEAWPAPENIRIVATATSAEYFFIITDAGYFYQLSAEPQPAAPASLEQSAPIWREVATPTPIPLN